MSTKRGSVRPQRRFWTDEEYGLIQSGEFSDDELAQMLDAPRGTIKKVRLRLNQGGGDQSNRYTPDEDDLIRERGPHMSAYQLAALLGRPWQSVSDRRRKLGVPVAKNYEPHQIAARPLIAKTCHDCGLLLQADWFAFYPSRRKWSARCRKCDSAYTARQPGQKASYERNKARVSASGRAWIAEAQAYTRQYATRNGFTYTDSDLKVLADPDMTIMDKALELKRTWIAASCACREHGFKSHVGIGDPVRDEWIIDNPNAPKVAA